VPERAFQKGEKMRKAAMLLLVALLVGALPAAAVPISMFPEPFVKAGTIYTTDGKATMAIIIGDKAASVDMIGAAMLAMKIGSHLYYTNAPYVNVDDAKAHGITLYYGGFDANSYYTSKTTLTLINATDGTTPFKWKQNGTAVLTDLVGKFFNIGGADCNKEGYDYILAPLENMGLPAKFHFILGENATFPKGSVSLPTKGFYLQTGLLEISKGADIPIKWLGFRLHVDNINFTIHKAFTRMINADGVTVAYMNLTHDFTFPDTGAPEVVIPNADLAKIKVGDHKGYPIFKIGTAGKDWIELPMFGVVLANFSTVDFTQNATTDEIATYYSSFVTKIGATAILNSTTYPVKAWGVWHVNQGGDNVAYIWDGSIFPYFDGLVNAYVFPKAQQWYVFSHKYGIGLWNFNKTWTEINPWWNKTKCDDFLFSSIGNRTEAVPVKCPLTEKVVPARYYCTFICGDYAGIYKIVTKEDLLEKLTCTFEVEGSTTVNMAKKQEMSTVYPREATGVFAGIFDRFENITGFKGTTQIKVETAGNVTYAKDVTQPEDVDQIFAGEAVFSFVKMPIIYLDSWVFVNNTLSADLANKDLILIGGPAVNTIVKYLNDAKLLDVTFKQVAGVWALEYAGKTYDLDTVLKILVDQGYLTAPISKEYVYRVEGGNGLGVVEYAKKNPFGSGQILVVAGTDRYGTLAASVALADPTKLVASTAPVFYAAGRTTPNAVILLGIKPTVIPPAVPPAVLTPVIVAIPAGAAG
jgi:hypothetical protein